MVRSRVPRKILGIIPARYASTRFPGKALARLDGLTMIEHVYDRASKAQTLSSLIVATDDRRIFDEARGFGALVQMTSADHSSGTDRAAEVASAHDDVDLVVNIQGDEPLIDPAAIDAAVRSIENDDNIPMATLKKRMEDKDEIADPNVVKVVTGLSGNALYFSRLPIPMARDGGDFASFKHIGLYVYRRDFLLRYRYLPVGPLERAEKLEQLRALENGYVIRVAETSYDSIGVDTPADLEKITARFADRTGITEEARAGTAEITPATVARTAD